MMVPRVGVFVEIRFSNRAMIAVMVFLGVSVGLVQNETAAAASARNEPVCVVSSKANLRARPSTAARVTWVVGRHMPLQRLAVENGWSQVQDLRGQTHWVISKNVSSEGSCAVVRVRTAALHRGPGATQPRAEFKVADRYTPFRKVDRDGAWVRLEDDYRGSYWTRESNVWIPVKRSRMSF